MARIRWSRELIVAKLTVLIGKYGRMPSHREMLESGERQLPGAIINSGRFVAWAEAMGAPMKDSDTKRGWAAEERVTTELQAVGLNPVRQRTRAPFDIQVGTVRVNVKSASFRSYGKVGAWFMGMGKSALHCDVFALVRYDRPDLPTLWIHSKDANQGTLSLTMNHRFNYMSLSIAPGSPLWDEMNRPTPPLPPPTKRIRALCRTQTEALHAMTHLDDGAIGFIAHGPNQRFAVMQLEHKGLARNAGIALCQRADCPKPSPHESEAFAITDAGRAELAKQEAP